MSMTKQVALAAMLRRRKWTKSRHHEKNEEKNQTFKNYRQVETTWFDFVVFVTYVISVNCSLLLLFYSFLFCSFFFWNITLDLSNVSTLNVGSALLLAFSRLILFWFSLVIFVGFYALLFVYYAKSQHSIYRVAQKSKPLPNDHEIVLNRIKACQWD